jgi:hypothetical protein
LRASSTVVFVWIANLVLVPVVTFYLLRDWHLLVARVRELLPLDPDASARALRAGVQAHLGVQVGVVVSDTAGRPWRQGVADLAIGAAGLRVLGEGELYRL